MATLQLAKQARELALGNRPARLYKHILKELPRVLMIYDIDNLTVKACRDKVRGHFYKQKEIQDSRVIEMLLEIGYMDLEDTLLQHKQKSQLMLLLEGPIGTEQDVKHLTDTTTEEEQFQRWIS